MNIKLKAKTIITIIALVLILLVFVFGVYSIMRTYTGVSNTARFESGDEHVLVRITGSYEGPRLTGQGSSSSYYYELNSEVRDAYAEKAVSIPGWAIGNTNFISHKYETIKISFVFDNLNQYSKMKVNVSNLAVDFGNHFKTEYVVAETRGLLATKDKTVLTSTSENIKTANISEIIVEKGDSVYIDLIYTLQNRAEAFSDFANNVSVDFESIVEE